jgi:hypothetical protein
MFNSVVKSIKFSWSEFCEKWLVGKEVQKVRPKSPKHERDYWIPMTSPFKEILIFEKPRNAWLLFF